MTAIDVFFPTIKQEYLHNYCVLDIYQLLERNASFLCCISMALVLTPLMFTTPGNAKKITNCNWLLPVAVHISTKGLYLLCIFSCLFGGLHRHLKAMRLISRLAFLYKFAYKFSDEASYKGAQEAVQSSN